MNKSGEDLRVRKGKKTYARIVDIAARLFTEKGYVNVTMDEIIQLVGVAKGGLYHHFPSKEALFVAAFEASEKKLNTSIEKSIAVVSDPWKKLLTGNHTFLTAFMDPKVRQIVARDAPIVLGWETYRKIDAKYSINLLRDVVKRLADGTKPARKPVDAITHAINGACLELGLWVGESKNSKRAMKQAEQALKLLCSALRREDAP